MQCRYMQLWPGAVSWPDFLARRTTTWWTAQLQALYSQIPLDGLWLDMNEPSNFCTGDVCTQYGRGCKACAPGLSAIRMPTKSNRRAHMQAKVVSAMTCACMSAAEAAPSTDYGCSLTCQNGAPAAGSNPVNLPCAGVQ